MKNKKYLFLLILLFPAALKLILEFTTINSHKLPYYGEKTAIGKDTIYQKVNDAFYDLPKATAAFSGYKLQTLDTLNYPLFAVCFIKKDYAKDNYRMAGLSEYVQFNKSKIKEIPFVIVTPYSQKDSLPQLKEFEKLSVLNKNIYNYHWSENGFDSLNRSYFKSKPFYIDYSFFVLVDKKRHIRGYYDGRYVAEVKRLIEEYQHLRLREEKDEMVKKNKIEDKNHDNE